MKLIIPAAGYGSRLWPLTKVIAKEFLPIGKNPAIDYILAEAINAGITEIIIVISKQKSYLQSYFEDVPYLPAFDFLRSVLKKIKIDFVYQEPTGMGEAVAKALEFCNLTSDELVAIALPDEILVHSNGRPCGLEQLLKCNQESILVQQTSTDILNLYGVIQFTDLIIKKIIEKPDSGLAPSDLAVVGRYLLNGQKLLFDLQEFKNTPDNMFILALNKSLGNRPIFLEKLYGKRFDTGSFEGYFKANNFFMLHNYKLI
jgi:UTP--glucose-1-phosphate uridylyltransferase